MERGATSACRSLRGNSGGPHRIGGGALGEPLCDHVFPILVPDRGSTAERLRAEGSRTTSLPADRPDQLPSARAAMISRPLAAGRPMSSRWMFEDLTPEEIERAARRRSKPHDHRRPKMSSSASTERSQASAGALSEGRDGELPRASGSSASSAPAEAIASRSPGHQSGGTPGRPRGLDGLYVMTGSPAARYHHLDRRRLMGQVGRRRSIDDKYQPPQGAPGPSRGTQPVTRAKPRTPPRPMLTRAQRAPLHLRPPSAEPPAARDPLDGCE